MKCLVFSCLSIALAASHLIPTVFAGSQRDDIFVKVVVPYAENLTEEDKEEIQRAKQELLPRRQRHLRSHRRLDPEWCDSVCRGVSFPHCQIFHPECYDHRRRQRALSERSMTEKGVRSLESTYELQVVSGTDCEIKKTEILIALEEAVIPASQPIVDGSHMTCYNLVEAPGRVNSFDLWNADTEQKVRSDMADGSLICNGDYSFSIEALADASVSDVVLRLMGPSGFDYYHTEGSAPFLLFGNGYDGNIISYSGNAGALENGDYTLEAMPEGNPDLMRTLHFTLADC